MSLEMITASKKTLCKVEFFDPDTGNEFTICGFVALDEFYSEENNFLIVATLRHENGRWEDYPNIYSLADVFAIPAEAELQSIVTMEAVASGLPVVAVDKGAVPELATAGNGFIFKPRDSKEMASYIVKILSDKKLQKSLSVKSLELAKKHSMAEVCTQYETVYQQLSSSKKS